MSLTINWRVLLLLACLTSASQAYSQVDLLPKGVGIYQYGYRGYQAISSEYNDAGAQVTLGSQFDQSFDSQAMASGALGPELQRLVQELNNFSEQSGGERLGDQLELGELRGDVQARLSAQTFGIGFGLTSWLTLFVGVPWVSADVKTALTFEGSNNALALKDELGELAFAELQAGLDRASAIGPGQVEASFAAKGYKPVERWSREGPGDVRVGLKTGKGFRLAKRARFGLGVTTQVEIPTGYVEQPDLLTDVSFGKGYYSASVKSQGRLTFFRHLYVGADGTYWKNFATTTSKRVPEGNETLVDQSRTATVNWAPGDDLEGAGSAGLTFSFLSLGYRNGLKTHALDVYSGELQGNYAALGEGSNSQVWFHEGQLILTSTKAYQRKKFPIPLIVSFTAHKPYAAINSNAPTYYELSFASFFSTPLAGKG